MPFSILTRRLLRARRGPPGTVPGHLGTSDSGDTATTVRIVAYGPDGFVERELSSTEELDGLRDRHPVLWIDVEGYANRAELQRLASRAGLHQLAMEDAVQGDHRPKAEVYPEHLFLLLRMLSLKERVETEQVNLFLAGNVVVTLQAGAPGDCFGPVRERIRAARGRIRARGADYLLYALVDAIVDNYFPVLDAFAERVEALEQEVVTNVDSGHAVRIQTYKHDLFALRRAVVPLGDAVVALIQGASSELSDETRLYFRDVRDHTHQLSDALDAYREVATGLMDVHLAAMNNRMSEVMKVLTLISTVFIPLSFIAGVYGMNFDTERSPFNMPELKWYFGYPFALLLMGSTAAALVAYFRSKRWFG